MNLRNWTGLICSAGLLFMLVSCQKEGLRNPELQAGSETPGKSGRADKYNTYKGPQVRMGNGHARSFVTISHAGVPIELGLEMTMGALNGLTQDPMDFAAATFNLPLHQKAFAVTPFDHITINWNPAGHPPEMFYHHQHFDFHFYMVSLEAQMATMPGPAMDILPPPQQWPAGYVPTEGGVPQMGKHWISPMSPEFNGHDFTATMMYGSYNGQITFVEPMVTRDFLLSQPNFSASYGQPQQYVPTNTYYPQQYRVYTGDKKETVIVSLTNFAWR